MYASLTRAGQKIVAFDIDNTADDNPHNAIYDHDDADRDVDGQTVFLGDHDVMVSDMAGFSAIDQSRDVFAHGQDESVELPKSPRGACDIENTLLATSGGPEGRDMSPPESGVLHSSAASGDLGGLVTASNTPSFSGSGQSVVVIDTGNGAYYNAHNVIFDHDFAHDDTDGRDPALFSHGAMVGDVVSDNAAGAGIIHLKVTSGFNRFARMEDIEAALDWVIENAETFNVAAVNVSMGFGDVNHEVATALSDEFQILKSEGVVTVVAAGNGGLQNNVEGINVLAANSNVIAVGAATKEGDAAGFSQKGQLLDVYAQGQDVAVDLPKFYRGEMEVDGTSFAAPQVAAAVAVAQEAALSHWGREMSPHEFEYLMTSTATDDIDGTAMLSVDAMLAAIQVGYDYIA
jgi:hypothetical protein